MNYLVQALRPNQAPQAVLAQVHPVGAVHRADRHCQEQKPGPAGALDAGADLIADFEADPTVLADPERRSDECRTPSAIRRDRPRVGGLRRRRSSHQVRDAEAPPPVRVASGSFLAMA